MLLNRVRNTVSQFLKSNLPRLFPGREALKFSAWLILIYAVVFLILISPFYFRTIGILFTLLMMVMILIIAMLSGLLLNLVISLLLKIPDFFRTASVGLLVFTIFFFALKTEFVLLLFLYLLLALIFTGSALYLFFKERIKPFQSVSATLSLFLLLVGVALLILWTYWLIQPGSEIEMPLIAALQTDYRPALIDIPNPAEPGPYPVIYLTYGSGRDNHRPEYGKMAELITESVDCSKLISGWSGISGKLRTLYFGFDDKELPLNGRVWYPDGVGPFPLILIIHGNHLAQDFSDPGYAYLGEHWASRGMISVSVDQNFLNGSMTDLFSGLKDENDARAYHLLQHIRQWHHWNETPDNPFYRRVDLDYIALIGHSRGGEAVAHAALFNRIPAYPDDGSFLFDFDFNIVSLIAIAPSDGQYQPSIVRTPLRDVNYLTLHGSHDGDVSSFSGKRQFERIDFSPGFDGFAATLYIYGANHGQFNTVWGRKDFAAPGINLYNLKQIMPGEEQRRIGMIFMTAFLERTLMYAPQYEELFIDYRTAPSGWLPETVYLQQYRRDGMQSFADFEEDLDLTTASIVGSSIRAENLTDWYERRIRLKHYSMDSKAVYLGWNSEEDSLAASYLITLPAWHENAAVFYITAADTGNTPSQKDKDESEEVAEEEMTEPEIEEIEETDEPEKIEYIDFTVRLSDDNDQEIVFPLSTFAPLQPRLEVKLGKLDLLHPTPYGEAVLQLFTFDLNRFAEENRAFNPIRIREIEFIFDRTEKGVILINEIGFMGK